MIQRIQTIYLLLIAGLMLAMFFLPVVTIMTIERAFLAVSPLSMILANGAYSTLPIWILPSLLFIGIILPAIAIFQYNNRKKQVKTCYWILAVLILICVFIFLLFSQAKTPMSFHLAVIFPVISVILDFLAIRGIKNDEKKVRAADRIR